MEPLTLTHPALIAAAERLGVGLGHDGRTVERLMRIAFAADHAGAALKDELRTRLANAGLGHELDRPRR